MLAFPLVTMQAVIGGQAHLLNEVTAPIAGAIEAGPRVPLFVTSATPDARFPKIPTALDVKLPNMLITGYYGLLAPQGTSPEVIQTLNRAMQTALKTPAVTQVFGNLGFKAEYSTPAQMAERIASVKANYQRIVTERGIKVQ